LTTLVGSGIVGDGYNYRETVSPWFRSIFLLSPQPELMAQAPVSFRIHALAGMAVFLIWPFTRLVHAFSAPIGYLFRPYVVYRTRGPHDPGNRPARRGWERVGN
ncbi:MAG: respiratory nitrate reductase subunit gamma, partial [Actinomycetes bacterium]